MSHHKSKKADPDDPMELVATFVPTGRPEAMATALIEEYAQLGKNEGEILDLFRKPIYGTHSLYKTLGEDRLRRLVGEVLSRTGRMRVRVEFVDQPGGVDA